MLITAVMLVLLLPMLGLLFDGSMLFIVKSRLQGAVDGAALAGAGPTLSTPSKPRQVS